MQAIETKSRLLDFDFLNLDFTPLPYPGMSPKSRCTCAMRVFLSRDEVGVFVPVQLERYKELKEMARRQGAILSQQAEKLRWGVKADYEKLDFDQRRRKEVEVPCVCVHLCVWQHCKALADTHDACVCGKNSQA